MYRSFLRVFCGMACVLASRTAVAGSAELEAARLLDRLGLSRGICALVGDEDCRLACALACRSELTLFVALPSREQVERACRIADEAGLYGCRVFVAQGTPQRIGLADNLADAAVICGADEESARVGPEEPLRVVRPLGKVLAGEKEWIKPLPAGADDWTHHYHGPDNNTQSRDRGRYPAVRTDQLTSEHRGARWCHRFGRGWRGRCRPGLPAILLPALGQTLTRAPACGPALVRAAPSGTLVPRGGT